MSRFLPEFVGFGSTCGPPPQNFELSQFWSYTRWIIWNWKLIDKSSQYFNIFWNFFYKKNIFKKTLWFDNCRRFDDLIMIIFFIDFYYNVEILTDFSQKNVQIVVIAQQICEFPNDFWIKHPSGSIFRWVNIHFIWVWNFRNKRAFI